MAEPAATHMLLDTALRYAAIGWAVFPLHTPTGGKCSCGADVCSVGKHPRTSDGFKSATTDPERIRGWWRTWPSANIGIATGARSGIFVLDVDSDKGGDVTLGVLISEHEQFPATVDAITGSGGRHVIFRHPGQSIPNSTQRLGLGLDVRGDGGYIVAAPSLHKSGALYEWQPGCAPWERGLAAAPEWLLEMVHPPPAAPLVPRAVPAGDQAYRRASAYLAKIPGAVSGQRGHDQAWGAALAVVRGFRLTESEAFSLLASEYNPRCEPPWSDRELEHKIRDAGSNARVSYGYLLDAERVPPRPASAAPAAGVPLFVPVGLLLDEVIPPMKWLIAPWLPRQSMAIVVSPPNAGKTLLALDFAFQAGAAGARVGIVEEEGSKAGFQLRVRRSHEAAGGGPLLRDQIVQAWNTGLSLLDPRDVARIVAAAQGLDLLILDSLAALTAGIDENDSKEMSAVAETLHRIKSETGATVLALHHMTKEAWKPGQKPALANLRGHGALAARADTALALVPMDEVAGCVRFELHVVKQRDAEKALPRKLEVLMTGPAATVTSEEVKSSAAGKRTAIESDVLAKVPETPAPAVSKKYLESVVRGYRATEIRAAVDRLVDADRVLCTPSGKYVRTQTHTASGRAGTTSDDPPSSRASPPRRGGTQERDARPVLDAAQRAAGEKEED